MPAHFTLFATALGRCGIAWTAAHVVAIQLPERDDAATAARLARLAGGRLHATRPPDFVRRAIASIVDHLDGKAADLESIPLDVGRVSDFERSVLETTRRIASGATRTYGAIAKDLGQPHAARAVGAALGRNPWPIVVPCHRVLAANGKLGGFSAPGGRATKLRLLGIEKAIVAGELFDRTPPGSDLFAVAGAERAASATDGAAPKP